MYPIEPPAIYTHDSVMADERHRARVEGVVRALRKPVEPIAYGDHELPALLAEHGLLKNRVPMGTLPEVRDPILLFNTFRWDGRYAERLEALRSVGADPSWHAIPLLGYGAFNWANYNLEGDPARHDKVCRPCWRIHLQNGCVHHCRYCPFGGLLICSVNVEEYCHWLGQIIERHPWQTTYLLDDDGDPPCLEPEHGVLGPLMEFFGRQKGRYLVIHTKTWNADWMRGVDHNGGTIIVWSVSGATQSRLIEPKTGTTEQRIKAARVAQDAGIQIRYKFKPIIPVKTWREDAAEAVRLVFEKTNPDVISLCCFMWMDIEEMVRRLGEELLDAEFVRAARDACEATKDTRTQPFPLAKRAEVYDHYLGEIRRWNPDVPVSLSTENFEMWKHFGPKLGFTATNYVCGCGPETTPGARRLECHPFKVAVRDDEGIPGTY
ncbi:MAG: hypothetical protein FJ291_01475 [Planctomycetes bacterium]|nr:hypothetical protein [Planctomycetota bacterium]